MVCAALGSGVAHRRTVFEMFARQLPGERRYGVVAGTGRFLDALASFRFSPGEIDYLRGAGVIDEQTASFLASYRFGGSIWGYAEGDCYFPGSPILVVDATFAEAVVLETLALSVFNHDCAVASAASRMVTAAGRRPIIEMGSRRTHELAAVAAARAAYLAGFASTSNLRAGLDYGVPTAGTSAHAFTMAHDDERQAFAAQLKTLGPGTTLLVDTYDVTGDLDERSIARLDSAPIDGYGVGTALVTGSGAPTAALVYKLVARADGSGELRAVAKHSVGKPTIGGRKWAVRRLDRAGTATAEVVSTSPPDDRDDQEAGHRALLRQLVADGEIVGGEPLATARERHSRALAELPRAALRLSPGEPAIPTLIPPASAG